MNVRRDKGIVFASATIALFVPMCCLAQTKPNDPSEEVRIPFVGCPGDGQAGPTEPPKGSDVVVEVDAKAAERLAYYRAFQGPGVLAPRGWNCFEIYGSSGGALFVSPTLNTNTDFLSEKWKGVDGPAIVLAVSEGGTSGRIGVAEVIARVFPARRRFVQNVIDQGLEDPSDFPFGPYPKDKLTYHGARIVEYETPAHTKGLGTRSYIIANDRPIMGVELLVGEEPDLFSIAVRLPDDTKELAVQIIRELERENPGDPPR